MLQLHSWCSRLRLPAWLTGKQLDMKQNSRVQTAEERKQSKKWQRFTLWLPGGAVGVTVVLLCPQSADRMHLIRRRSRKLREELQH